MASQCQNGRGSSESQIWGFIDESNRNGYGMPSRDPGVSLHYRGTGCGVRCVRFDSLEE